MAIPEFKSSHFFVAVLWQLWQLWPVHAGPVALRSVVTAGTSNSRPIGAVPSHNNPSNKGLGAPRSLNAEESFPQLRATERPKNSEFPEK